MLRRPLLTLTLVSACALYGCADEERDEAVRAQPQALSAQKSASLDKQLKQALGAHGGKNAFKLPKRNQLSKIPQDPANPLNKDKVKLGELLMHETGMGVENVRAQGALSYSCASCHHADAGFQAGRRQGIGEGGEGFFVRSKSQSYDAFELDVQPVRSPSVLNGAYQKVMLWNGQFGATGPNQGTQAQWTAGTPKESNFLGFEGLEIQAIAGMGVHRLSFMGSALTQNQTYIKLFDKAFKDQPRDQRMSDQNAGLAIAAFERTVLADKSPWQEWLSGKKSAMSEAQKRGALLFFGEANCVACHSGPALNSMSFHALGMNDLEGPDILGEGSTNPERLGRGGFTQNPDDLYKFKTPQLYNLVDSPFYGHGASFGSVREVLEYKNQGVAQNPIVPSGQLAAEFVPLGLSSSQLDDLQDFIEHALHDPELGRYEPGELPSGLCTPHNDAQSRLDLGCDSAP